MFGTRYHQHETFVLNLLFDREKAASIDPVSSKDCLSIFSTQGRRRKKD
jgi:hypothetical protein